MAADTAAGPRGSPVYRTLLLFKLGVSFFRLICYDGGGPGRPGKVTKSDWHYTDKEAQNMEQQNIRFEEAKEKIIGVQRPKQGIGTLAEKTVHAVLKHYYAPDEDMHEIPIEQYVADIYTGFEIIEIQTRQMNKMRNKLNCFLALYPVTVVYPVPREKWLIWIDEASGQLTNKRKSPAKGTPYHAFAEFYKIKMYLKNPNLRFRIVMMDLEEYRLLNGWSKDKKKGSTRYDRIPKAIEREVDITCLQDYMQFVPDELAESFTVKDFARAARIPPKLSGTVVHILSYVGVIRQIGKQGRCYLYQVNGEW